MDKRQREQLAKMATPARMGEYIGKQFLGKPYKAYPWIKHMEQQVLTRVESDDQEFLAVNVPPQNGKTTYFGLLLPVWYLGMHPYNNVIFITYADNYSMTWGQKARDLMQQFGQELFGETVSSQQDAKGDWRMANGIGGMLSVGIGGQITGRSGDLIIIDDVIKGMEDAASLAAKDKHFTEFEGSITTRYQENTTVIIDATRFADDDLTGRVLERQVAEGYEGDVFDHINIKAIAEPDEELEGEELEEWRDFLGRKKGEGLHGRYSLRHYERRRKTLSTFVFEAVYQGTPVVRDGGMFPESKWKYWKTNDPTMPAIVRKVRVWDLATTEGGGDWTVGSLWGLYENGDICLLHVHRVQRSAGEVEKLVMETARWDGWQVKIIIEQEKAGAGHAVVEHYKRKLAGYIVEPGKTEGTKEQRATPYSSMQTNGRIWLPEEDKELCRTWKDEHRRMMGDGRRPRHDDRIDTGAYAVMDLLMDGGLTMFSPNNDELHDEDGNVVPLPDDDHMLAVLLGTNPYVHT